MKTLFAAIATVIAIVTAPGVGADDKHHGTDAQTSVQTPAILTNAEVRKVDKAGKRITLKHEEIKSLDMPPMTMVFRVKDAAMLDRVKLGDKVMFSAENTDGAYTVTTLKIAQ